MPRQSLSLPRKHPFQLKNKKIGEGNFKKIIQRVFSGRASGCVRPQALGLSLRSSAFTLEIGSSFGVKYHQFGTKMEIVAQK